MDAAVLQGEVWLNHAPSWEKFPDNTEFADVRQKQETLSILAARNAYECGQIILCTAQETRKISDDACDPAKKNVIAYKVSLSDLTAENGAVYAKENIAVYAEKYIEVDRNWHTNGLPTGNYPDALIPLENAKEHGEAVAVPGRNRGIWLEFFVPENQKPDIYRGEITVDAAGSHTMAIRLEVLDIAVPEETGVKSLFHTNFEHMSHYEKGDMHKMYDTYLHYLLRHRICQTEILHVGHSDQEMEAFCEKAAQLCREGMTTIGIPTVETELDGYKTYSSEYLVKYLCALAKKSVESGINILQRAAFYDWLIDEPFFASYVPGQVSGAVERFEGCIQEALAVCRREACFATAKGEEILSSLEQVSHVVTDMLYSSVVPVREKQDALGNVFAYDCRKVALCPRYEAYETQESASLYEDCREKWWYGCNVPGAPFVSYHIDDAAYSPRIVGWLMARYGITGNLYWANNICTEINTTGSPLFLEDPYGTAHRGFGANGDGAILYPGSIYGIDGPVGSIRIKQIREGNQDYDILRAVQQRYEGQGASFWGIFDRITASICDGTKIDSMIGDFGKVRESILRLCEAACSPLGLVVEVECDREGITFAIHTTREAELYADGKRIPGEDGHYCIRKEFRTDAWFNLTVYDDGKEVVIPLYQGRGLEIIIHETLFAKGAVTADKGTVVLNPDGVRREITVVMEEPDCIHIDLGTEVFCGESLGFELKTKEPCVCTIFADGYEQQKRQILTRERWNRIEIPTGEEGFITRGIHICCDEPKKVGIGAVYIHR